MGRLALEPGGCFPGGVGEQKRECMIRRTMFAMEMIGLTHSNEMPPLQPRRARLALLLRAMPPPYPPLFLTARPLCLTEDS